VCEVWQVYSIQTIYRLAACAAPSDQRISMHASMHTCIQSLTPLAG
jgi:hypothetical protein